MLALTLFSVNLNCTGIAADASAGGELLPESFLNLLYRDCEECYLFIAEISTQKAYLYRVNKKEFEFQVVREFEIASGKQKGAKRSEYDLRTPAGFYEITQYRPAHTLQEKFGPGAYVLNYPNALERAEKLTGSGIWIHGTDRIDFIDYDSEGCIRIKNDELPLLRNYLKPRQSPVIIVERINKIPAEQLKANKEQFDLRLQNWLASWRENRLEDYLAFYHPSFYSPNVKMDFVRWKRHKENIPADKLPVEITLHKMQLIYREDTIFIQAEQHYRAESFSDKGTKSLIWKQIGDDWYIVYEDWKSN